MLVNYVKLSEAYVFIYVVTMKSTVKCMLFIVLFCLLWIFAFISHPCCSSNIVPQSYTITKSDQFLNKDPDYVGCVSENQKTNCSAPGKLFDGVKPVNTSNASLFHLWQIQSNNNVQLMLNFQESVIIRKMVWTFNYNSSGSLAIPAANITQWNLTAYNGSDGTVTDQSITRKTMDNRLLVYTMVVQGSVAAQRWGSTFSAPNGQWLLLSEVEIFGYIAGVCLNTILVSHSHLYRPFA